MKRREMVKSISIVMLGMVMYDQALAEKANCVQIKKGKMYGIVEGEKGNYIAEAKVKLTNTKTREAFLTETGLDGKFSIAGVSRGTYILIVEVVGYESQIRRVVEVKQSVLKFEKIIFPDHSEKVFKQAVHQQEQANLLIEIVSEESFYILKPSDGNVNERNDFQSLISISEKIEKDLAVVILGKGFNFPSDPKPKSIVSKINLLLNNSGFKKVIFHQSYSFGFEVVEP